MTSTEDRKVKVGVVGVGSLGQHHARIYSELPSVELAGVYDVNQERAEHVASACSTRFFPTLDELVANVDAASIVVPTTHHFEVASRLMGKRVHVLVEKPIASSREDAESMVVLAQEKGIVLQVGHVERFNPVMKFLEESLTQPRFIEVIRLAPYPPPRDEGVPRGTEVSVVLDLMIHDLDIILQLVRSPVTDIHAVGVPVLSPTEDISNVRLLFGNGCVANVTASRISQERMRKIRVFQSDTYLSLDYMKQSGQLCRKTVTGITSSEVPIEKGDPLTAELVSFVQSVLRLQDPVVTGEHGCEALRLAVEICRQLRESPS